MTLSDARPRVDNAMRCDPWLRAKLSAADLISCFLYHRATVDGI